MAVILGPAIATLFAFDLTHYPDCRTYLGLADFNFNQSPVRRYRVIIPFTAAVINYIAGGIAGKFAPSYFVGNYSLPFSFFIINTMLTAYFGVLIYQYCKAFGIDKVSSLVGTLVMLTCRYTAPIAALPLVDSLFCVVIALSLLGIKRKNTSMLLWAIFLGPFAKEAFIFIAPLIFFFSHIPKKKLLLFFLLSGILVFTCRYLYDLHTLHPATGGLRADLYHLYRIKSSVRKLFTISTILKLLLTIGFWLLAPILAAFSQKSWLTGMLRQLDKYLIWFMVSVVLQMLLSGSMERMFYLAMPLICVIVGFSIEQLKKTLALESIQNEQCH